MSFILQFAMERYTIKRVLANALYGDVVLCIEKATGQQVAIKRMEQNCAAAHIVIDEGRLVSEDIEFEKQVNRALQVQGGHPNVLAMRDDFIEDGYEHFVFDFCSGGELFEATDKLPNQQLDTANVRRYFCQIANGVHFIHACGFGHRDLSLENVLLDEEDNCRVCDFGLAATLETKQMERVGKSFYMAPEVLAGIPYNAAISDVWSLGIILFILITGAPLVEFADFRDNRFQFIESEGLRELVESWQMTDLFDPLALSLLEQMLCINPDSRITLEEVLEHPFVSGNGCRIELAFDPSELSVMKLLHHCSTQGHAIAI